MRKIVIDRRTGAVVSQEKLKAKTKWRLTGLLLITVAVSLLPDFHLKDFFGWEYQWWQDVVEHGGYYFLITSYIFHLLPSEKRSLSLFLSIFGISVTLEFFQLLTVTRTFSLFDIFCNFCGILAAFYVNYVAEEVRNSQR